MPCIQMSLGAPGTQRCCSGRSGINEIRYLHIIRWRPSGARRLQARPSRDLVEDNEDYFALYVQGTVPPI